MQKINKNWSAEITTTLKYMITSVNGNTDIKFIRQFVDSMPIRDSRALRDHVIKISPEIERKFNFEDKNGDVQEGLSIPMTVEFFWPK